MLLRLWIDNPQLISYNQTMSKRRGYKKTTLDSINRALGVAGITTVKAVRGRFKYASLSLRYDDNTSPEDLEKAKLVVGNLMGDLWWGDPV